MGPLESILGMIPGMGDLKQLADNKPDEKQMGRVEAIICSMTADERRNDKIINGSRRKRIAKGSGTSVEEVNRLLKQFGEMKKMLAMLGGGGGMPKLPKGMKVPPQMAQMQRQAAAQATPGGGKKRKKGGPWGLMKSR